MHKHTISIVECALCSANIFVYLCTCVLLYFFVTVCLYHSVRLPQCVLCKSTIPLLCGLSTNPLNQRQGFSLLTVLGSTVFVLRCTFCICILHCAETLSTAPKSSCSPTSQVPQPTQEVGWGFNALKSWKFFFRAFQNRQLAMYRAGW